MPRYPRGFSSGRFPDWLEQALDEASEAGFEQGENDGAEGEDALEGDELREYAEDECKEIIERVLDDLRYVPKLRWESGAIVNAWIEGYEEGFEWATNDNNEDDEL